MLVDGDDRKYNRGWVNTHTHTRKTHFLASLAALIAACSSSVFSPAAEAGEDAASTDMGRAVPGAAGRRRRVDRDDGGDAAHLGDDDDDDDKKAETRNDGRPRTTTAARRVAAADRRRIMRRRGAMKFFGCRAAGLVVRRRREVGERWLWERETAALHCMHSDGLQQKKSGKSDARNTKRV